MNAACPVKVLSQLVRISFCKQADLCKMPWRSMRSQLVMCIAVRVLTPPILCMVLSGEVHNACQGVDHHRVLKIACGMPLLPCQKLHIQYIDLHVPAKFSCSQLLLVSGNVAIYHWPMYSQHGKRQVVT